MDSALIPEGSNRCGLGKFTVWAGFCLLLILWGAVSALLCLILGLNQTNMSDYFAFGLWIVVDLAIIALGAGAFSTGLYTHIMKMHDLKPIGNAAVVIGFLCYSGAVAMLGIDIGQPIRGWFIFWHANVHSMLTEVSFCITTYLIVLIIEYLPIILENRQIQRVRPLKLFGHNLHSIVIVFAGVGTFLSFFHQGSLGGMFGVLYARPFAYRGHFFIWPSTFFLFVLSAVACGPAFTSLIVWITQKVSGRKLVPEGVFQKLGKICGYMLGIYLILKFIDTLYWAFALAPADGLTFSSFYRDGPYGMWLMFLELGVCGVIPAIILLRPNLREREGLLITAFALDCAGIVLNRFVFVIQTLAIPVLPFENFLGYTATWQEWGISFGVIGYGMLLYSLSYRYLPLFPREKALNTV